MNQSKFLQINFWVSLLQPPILCDDNLLARSQFSSGYMYMYYTYPACQGQCCSRDLKVRDRDQDRHQGIHDRGQDRDFDGERPRPQKRSRDGLEIETRSQALHLQHWSRTCPDNWYCVSQMLGFDAGGCDSIVSIVKGVQALWLCLVQPFCFSYKTMWPNQGWKRRIAWYFLCNENQHRNLYCVYRGSDKGSLSVITVYFSVESKITFTTFRLILIIFLPFSTISCTFLLWYSSLQKKSLPQYDQRYNICKCFVFIYP